MGSIAEIIKRQHLRLAKQFCLDLAGENTVLLSGSGRSGTSWLANLCNYQNDFRYIFEPLNPDLLPLDKAPTKWCLGLDDECVTLQEILRGELSASWVNSRNRRLIAHRRLIKGIRTNLMLAWINHHHRNVKTVLILRNPLAVAASRKSLSRLTDNSRWVWKPSPAQLLAEPGLRCKLSAAEFDSVSQQLGRGVVMETIAEWCLSNLVATREISFRCTYPIFYEDLLNQPEATLKALFAFLDIRYQKSVLTAHRRRSETSRNPHMSQLSTKQESQQSAERWRTILNHDEQSAAIELLNQFDISRLYSAEWQPRSLHSFII